MFLKALLAPAALIGLASAVALPPSNGLDLSTHSLNKRTATMWTWFPPIVHATPWKYVGCFSGDVPLTYHVADFCSCHNTAVSKHMNMEKCFASCKAAGFRYAGLKGPNGAKKCWCGSADPSEYKLPSAGTCNVACGDGEGNTLNKYSTSQCGGQTSYSIWRDPCYKRKFDIENAPLGYESAGCWSGHGGWLLAHFEKSVSGDNLSIDSCIEACSANGYPYAGMRGGWECFCGGRLSPHFVDVHQKNPNHNTMCTKVCTSTWKVYATTPKEEWQYCGGDVYYSLYFNRKLAASTADVCKDDDDEDGDETVTKVVQTITVTKGGPPPTEATQSFDSDKTTRTTITVPGKVVQTVTVTKGGPPPTEATQSFDSDKTTRTTITITGKAEPTPDPEDDDKDDKEDDDKEGGDDDDDDDEPTQTTTITLTRTSGGPAPKTDPPGKGTVYVTTTVPARAKTTITLTQTSGSPAPTGKNNKNTVYTTVTVPAKRTKTTITLTQTSGEAAPTGKNNKNTVYTTVTVPAKRTKTTITLTQTSGQPAPTGKNNKNTVYTTVTVPPKRGNGGKTTTITLTRTSGGPAPTTARPGKGTVYVTTTVPATEPSNKPEEPEDDDDDKKDDGDDKDDDENPDDKGNPGGKGGDDDDKKDDDGKKDDDDKGNPGGKGGDDDDKKDDGENPDDNNGNPGGKGGEEPGDKGPDLDDSLCSKPMVPEDVLKNTKWKDIKFPVGDVQAPAVSCHNRKSKYDAGYHFKLFVGPGTAWPDAVCRKEYTRKPTEIQAACSNACIEQKKSCTSSSKVRKIADYKALCEAQLVACQAINSLKVLPKYIELINNDYCKKPSPPFPKPPKAGGKPADDDEEEEIQYS